MTIGVVAGGLAAVMVPPPKHRVIRLIDHLADARIETTTPRLHETVDVQVSAFSAAGTRPSLPCRQWKYGFVQRLAMTPVVFAAMATTMPLAAVMMWGLGRRLSDGDVPILTHRVG